MAMDDDNDATTNATMVKIVATALGASWRSTYFALQHARHSKMGLPINPDYYLHLGPLCVIFRDAYRNGPNLAACERVGLSDYVVAHHITDMYHHRNFRVYQDFDSVWDWRYC